MGFWRTIDRVADALRRGNIDEARRLLRVAVAQHRGPYEASSLRAWQEQINQAEEARERKTA
jgi:hypothetical protein